jgi:hypothetical protein
MASHHELAIILNRDVGGRTLNVRAKGSDRLAVAAGKPSTNRYEEFA